MWYTEYTHEVPRIYTCGAMYIHVVPFIYTCCTLYIHMMMSGDGCQEHDQLWVTNDGDNIESNGIIFMNERYYFMRQ